MGDPGSLEYGWNGDFKLHQEDVTGPERSLGGSDVLIREIKVSPGSHNDAVLGILVNSDQCHPGRLV